jgi:hypothetical protein
VAFEARYWVDNRSGLDLVLMDIDKSVLGLPRASLLGGAGRGLRWLWVMRGVRLPSAARTRVGPVHVWGRARPGRLLWRSASQARPGAGGLCCLGHAGRDAG